MKNKLGDLNNYLFEQLERLNDDELVGENLNQELNRAKGIGMIANQIINTGSLALKAQQFMDDRLDADGKLPAMLEA